MPAHAIKRLLFDPRYQFVVTPPYGRTSLSVGGAALQAGTKFDPSLVDGRRLRSLNAYGDPVPGAASTWTFDGIVDSFSAFFAATAGIPATDVRVLIIAGSLATVPQQDDQVAFRGEWYQLRRLVERDPANATYIFSGFKIEDPT
jgi:hypothetical protein